MPLLPTEDTAYLSAEPVVGPARRTRRFVAAGMVAVVAVVAGVAGVVASSSGGHRPMTLTLAPGAFVSAAAEQTLAEKTAGVTVSGTVHVQGQSVLVQGDGKIDFVNRAADLQMNMDLSQFGG